MLSELNSHRKGRDCLERHSPAANTSRSGRVEGNCNPSKIFALLGRRGSGFTKEFTEQTDASGVGTSSGLSGELEEGQPSSSALCGLGIVYQGMKMSSH